MSNNITSIIMLYILQILNNTVINIVLNNTILNILDVKGIFSRTDRSLKVSQRLPLIVEHKHGFSGISGFPFVSFSFSPSKYIEGERQEAW